MAASITDHVIKLQELTQKNLDILQAINDSFFTDRNHLTVAVGDSYYTIPSFISLENKLNSLTANFKNLVNAPESGEAFFNFDGNSRTIEVRSYTTTPESLKLEKVQEFFVEKNDIFKDFLTPNPYIHLNVQSLPNDTTQVMVKKIIPISSELINIFQSQLKNQTEILSSKCSVTWAYKDLYKILSQYVQDVDYIEYDTKVDLPIRKTIGTGTYVIDEILEDYIDDNLINYITIKLRSDLDPSVYMSSLKYRLFDETIERALKVGDQLVTFEGTAKMEITEIRQNTNTIVVKVLNGEFLNLTPSYNNDEKYLVHLNKLRFFSSIDFNKDKYVKVPLEEDRYIYVAVAALNSRMNVQSPWGSGLVVDSYSLSLNENGETKSFKTYYDENVQNIGDILFEISSMMPNTLTKYSIEEYNKFISYKPNIDLRNLSVVQINSHLNDSESVKNIRSLYSQKKELQQRLSDTQAEIESINNVLSSVSYDDVSGRRTAYTNQLSSLNTSKNELNASILRIINEISIAANNSITPIENAKYRIRGFFDPKDCQWGDHIKGLRVWYRYKNENKDDDNNTNQVTKIGDTFVFSDWNEMISYDKVFTPKYDSDNHKFTSELQQYEDDTKDWDGPRFNQIDIPISQGESVDIKLKIIYDFGAPFTQVSSVWSDVVNMSFPVEFLKDVKILDIIEENNNDIEANRFNNIIREEGIPDHISDKIIDQDITYYHKPENIASGFYTEERRIIPLKDKLEDLNNIIIKLQDEIHGTFSDNLTVEIYHDNSYTTLQPFIETPIATASYSSLISDSTTGNLTSGNYKDIKSEVFEASDTNSVSIFRTFFELKITNNSSHAVKLFSMFPGDPTTKLNLVINNKYSIKDYCIPVADDENVDKGVWCRYLSGINTNTGDGDGTNQNVDQRLQSCNQFLYFRINDVITSNKYYDDTPDKTHLGLKQEDMRITSNSILDTNDSMLYIYPTLNSQTDLCLNDSLNKSDIGSYIVLNTSNSIIIPIAVEFYVVEGQNISKTISFELLPSLYKDPINYKFTVVSKYEDTVQDNLLSNLTNNLQYKDVKYKSTYR